MVSLTFSLFCPCENRHPRYWTSQECLSWVVIAIVMVCIILVATLPFPFPSLLYSMCLLHQVLWLFFRYRNAKLGMLRFCCPEDDLSGLMVALTSGAHNSFVEISIFWTSWICSYKETSRWEDIVINTIKIKNFPIELFIFMGGTYLCNITVPLVELKWAQDGLGYVTSILRANNVVLEGDSRTIICWI